MLTSVKPAMRYFLPLLCLNAICLWADGHGPAFGFSTAILGAGDSSVGTAMMWRGGVAMIAPEVAYSWNGNVQYSLSAPFHQNHGGHPVGRFTALTHGDPAVEFLTAWRFHHSLTGVGTRNESTLYVGASATTQSLPRADGPPLREAPGLYVAAATGHVSRRFYAWEGAGYEHYASQQDHQSDTALASLVLGWRPPFLENDYPKPDWRFFWETTGERIGKASRGVTSVDTGGHDHGATTPLPPADASGVVTLPDSGGNAVYSGPTFLVTYKDIALQSGVLLPVWRDMNGIQPPQRFRAVISFTYYFLGGKK
jgi:hypothetical protein